MFWGGGARNSETHVTRCACPPACMCGIGQPAGALHPRPGVILSWAQANRGHKHTLTHMRAHTKLTLVSPDFDRRAYWLQVSLLTWTGTKWRQTRGGWRKTKGLDEVEVMCGREREERLVTWLACLTTIVPNRPPVHTCSRMEKAHGKTSDVTVNEYITRWSPVTRRAVSLRFRSLIKCRKTYIFNLFGFTKNKCLNNCPLAVE